jgi:hypothetical protein
MLIGTLMTGGMGAFVLNMVLWFYWLDHSPAAPRTDTGQTYPLNNHGYYFYVTKAQNLVQEGLMVAFVVGVFGGAFLNQRWKLFSRHNKLY